ncbi:carbohydrate kinase family protein [Oceanispirochaeta sp.]|jgi:sugar/nucleoside kinase (ribokinase family)|uniref:carbohydrate kinase family protein n=1 Tax=Oceanispirochaeta sp. TaxID=2035350 RepID=UPI0026378009|nr:carbohydrate kinase family protein [Oceanispirochaeta sp.]MDA3956617.1 carbohydrate kinase family protein [Oceanispirochaeta sp.]
MKKIISSTGCCLLDYIYTDFSFNNAEFKKYSSRQSGDGGLIPGHLVFAEDLAEFAGETEDEVLNQLCRGKSPDTVNLGGPGVVAMVHASQVLFSEGWDCTFYGVYNQSEEFRELQKFLDWFPLKYIPLEAAGAVPSTTVLSDPGFKNGSGERTFINRLGAADHFNTDLLDQTFFNGDIILWGGSALVPPLHDNLTELLKKSKNLDRINILGTVYDFRNESKNPIAPWPLGGGEGQAYPYIDLMMTDYQEALRLSGTGNLDDAADFFKNSGLGAFIITRGRDDLYLYSNENGLFKGCSGIYLPVSPYVDADLVVHPEKKGDTTGCGDNFMGGVLVSIARQLDAQGIGPLDPVLAAIEGICSGGLALYSKGGCIRESHPGEKEEHLRRIRQDYLENTLPGINGPIKGMD